MLESSDPNHTPADNPEESTGSPPVAVNAAASSPAPSELQQIGERLDQLESANVLLRAENERLRSAAEERSAEVAPERPKPKDGWDRLGLIAPVFATLTIGLFGLYFTRLYQENQVKQQTLTQEQNIRVQRIEALSKLLPYLAGQNAEQEQVAVEAMYAVAGAEISSTLARLHPSEGTRQGLLMLQRNPLVSAADRRVVAYALSNFPRDLIPLQPAGPQTWTPAQLDSLRRVGLKEAGAAP